jgi:energy-coupling factor transporter ATP-binding protein EcfA2
MRIAIIGNSGSGKSTLGRQLSAVHTLTSLDLDTIISHYERCLAFSTRQTGDAEVIERITVERRKMLYLVVEHFRGGDALPVYRRFRDQGRLVPDGLKYVSSWVTQDLRRCFQIMECDNPLLLEQWMGRWDDLIEFEVIPVMTSADAAATVAPRL